MAGKANRNVKCDEIDNQIEALRAGRAPASRAQLRRLPHVFCKVIDLPFSADTNVVMEERKDAYMFFIPQGGLAEADVVAEAVQIVPGSTKVTLRGADQLRANNPSMEMGNWRARLPPCTIPEAAKATYAHGIITITIPKMRPPAPSRSCGCASDEMKRSLPCLV